MRTLGSFTRPLLTSILGPVCIALPALNPQPWTCFAQGNLTPLGAISPLTLALDRQLMFRRLHVAGKWKDVAVTAIG